MRWFLWLCTQWLPHMKTIASYLKNLSLMLITIFSPREQFHLHTQCSSNPALLLLSHSLEWLHHPSWWTPVSKLRNWPRPILDQSDSSRHGLAIRDFLIQYSRILRRSALVSFALPLSWVTPQMSSPEQSRADTGYRTRVGRRKCNKPVPLNLHPSQAFILTLEQTCPLSTHWTLNLETRI